MDTNKLLQERTDRIMKAIHHEKPDRTPLVLNGSVAMMKHTDPNSTTGMYVRDPISCLNNLIVPALEKLPNIDMLTGAGMWPGATGMAWMCKTKLPGRELPEDALWQLDEQNFMTRDDYDIILHTRYYTNPSHRRRPSRQISISTRPPASAAARMVA